MSAYIIVFDKLIWHTIGPKSFLFGTAQFSFWASGAVNYDYILTNTIKSLLIGSICIPNGTHTNHCWANLPHASKHIQNSDLHVCLKWNAWNHAHYMCMNIVTFIIQFTKHCPFFKFHHFVKEVRIIYYLDSTLVILPIWSHHIIIMRSLWMWKDLVFIAKLINT